MSMGQAELGRPVRLTTAPGSRPHTFRLSWEKPANSDAISYYFRVYIKAPGMGWKKIGRDVDDEFTTEYESNQLEPVSTYSFKVESYSNLRLSGPSAEVTVTTGESVPTAAPRGLRVMDRDIDSITLAWDPPPAEEVKGELTGYVIDFDLMGDSTFNTRQLPPTAQSFTDDFLESGKTYRYQLCAMNSTGEGPFTAIVEATTDKNKSRGFGGRRKSELALELDAPQQPAPLNRKYSIRGNAAAPSPAVQQQPDTTRAVPKPVWKPKPKPAVVAAVAEPTGPRTNPAAMGQAAFKRRQSMEALHSSTMSRSQKQAASKTTLLRNGRPQETGNQLSKGVGVELPKGPTRYEQLEYWKAQLKPSELSFDPSMKKSDAMRLLGRTGSTTLVDGSGAVRGQKDVVASAIGTFNARADVMTRSDLQELLYANEKDNKIVVYISSLESIRRTRDACNSMLKIFDLLQLKVQVKDVHLERRFARELRERTRRFNLDTAVDGDIDEDEDTGGDGGGGGSGGGGGGSGSAGANGDEADEPQEDLNHSLPQVFINAVHIGGLERIQYLVDTGELKRYTANFEKRSNETCRSCGGQGFVVCQWCQGSRKSLAHDFNSGKGKHNFFLNCTVCNSNGLQPCPDC